MAPKKAPKKVAKKSAKPSQVIELSSDSESGGGVSDSETPAKPSLQEDFGDQPLLRAQGINYKTDQSPKSTPEKLPVRVKQTGSAKHRHVSIEIPLPSSSVRARDLEVPDSEDEVFKTPMGRKHVKFDDSDHDEFVTPREVPSKDPMSEIRPAQSSGKGEKKAESDDEDEDEEEDSDDEAPEAVSTHAAEAQLNKAAQAVAKAAEQQAVIQKRKRQERDAFLKQQVEERKTAQKALEEEEEEAEVERPSEHSEKRKRDLPKLLPLELLDSDEEDAGDDSDATDDGNSKRRRVDAAERKLALAPKTPKDAKVGSTVFRVAKSQGDQKLAPRRQLQSLNAKEELLRRNRKPQTKGGFFVRK
ncbi:hypothetical protein B0T19DRAFT_417288 [Cercophora scortea]|uniref:Uncharacterized protein n=1 Tax=Cercophora scortea TaxID=314031 RepID=A0AAE0IY05_9PEZI|nr:hypothetical protein B0T19DRAFT_417288 [Cercophora scortea]